eukprot:COSAG06_NODE_850_length_11961_cov_34.663126_13_plen_97_part_00
MYGCIYVMCCQDDKRRSVPHSEAVVYKIRLHLCKLLSYRVGTFHINPAVFCRDGLDLTEMERARRPIATRAAIASRLAGQLSGGVCQLTCCKAQDR